MRLEPQKSVDTYRILIAEDDAEFRKLLVDAFRAEGYEVTACRHGMDLMENLRYLFESEESAPFDLIISDIRMPGVTGLSVLAGLRELKNAPPIILITAFGDEATHAEARALGAVATLDKPLELDDLLLKAQEALSR